MTAPLLPMAPRLKLGLPWGGDQLQKRWGKNAPASSPLGESWEVSCIRDEESRVAFEKGPTLTSVFEGDRAHFLGPGHEGSEFPLLVKLIGTKQLLSLQVHPDDEQARRLDGKARGKHEAWLILEAGDGAAIDLGVRPGVTAAMLRDAAASRSNEAVKSLLRRVPVRAGQVFDIRPGTLHAIGAGIVLLEVQQPSDLTYRVWDWGRVGEDGKPRELHLEKALEVTEWEARPEPVAPLGSARRGMATRLLEHERFRIERWRVDGEQDVLVKELILLTCIGGRGEIGSAGISMAFEPGRSCVVPRGATMIRLRGSALELAAMMPPA